MRRHRAVATSYRPFSARQQLSILVLMYMGIPLVARVEAVSMSSPLHSARPNNTMTVKKVVHNLVFGLSLPPPSLY